MAYYAYQRVSTETQSEHGYGLEAQRAAIAKYADEHGLTIEHYFIDAGISGNIKDTDGDEAINARAGLLELLATLTEGDTIGYVGSTGNSTGPHLHFEVRSSSSGGTMDPLGFSYY